MVPMPLPSANSDGDVSLASMGGDVLPAVDASDSNVGMGSWTGTDCMGGAGPVQAVQTAGSVWSVQTAGSGWEMQMAGSAWVAQTAG